MNRIQFDYNLAKIANEISDADNALQNIPKAITIFGSARIKESDPYYQKTKEIAQLLAQHQFAIISGGGPGIMAAANQGAVEGNGVSVGLNIVLPNEQRANQYQTIPLSFSQFFPRKITFFKHSCAYICMPGGFGTLDELSEVLTLCQTNKMPSVPVILYDEVFWKPFYDWIHSTLVVQGLVSEESLSWLHLVSTKEDILEIVV